MRSFLLAILLFALMIFGIAANTVYLERLCDELADAIAALPDMPDQSTAAADRITARWTKARPLVGLSVGDSTLNRIDDLLAALRAHMAAGSLADYTLAREQLRRAIEDLRSTETSTWEKLM